MIILFGQQKGGCGKSTLAVNIAAEIAKRDTDDIVILDADRQETAASWTEERDETGITPRIPLVQKYGNIRNTIYDLAKKYKHVIIDVAGRNSDEMISAMTIADVIVMPFKTSSADFGTIPKMQELIDSARMLNPKLRNVALLNMCATSVTNRNEVADFKAVLDSVEGFEIAPNVYDRKAYRDCLIDGEGVIDMSNKLAKQEISSLYEIIFK